MRSCMAYHHGRIGQWILAFSTRRTSRMGTTEKENEEVITAWVVERPLEAF